MLRVLRGLWPVDQGVVAMVGDDQVGSVGVAMILQLFERLFTIFHVRRISSFQLACLPQREFLGQGSLRELLTPGEDGQVLDLRRNEWK